MSSIVNANRLPALFFGIFFFMQIFLLHGNSQAQDIFKITTRTTDKTNTLSADEKQVLDDSLYAIEKNTGRQVVVVLIPSTGSQSIEDYATELFRENGIGDKERNDGVLILVAKEDRKMRIEVGYGLEGTITDLIASGIINQQMKPRFKDGDFYEGISAAVNTISKLISGNITDEELNALKGDKGLAVKLTKDGRALLFVFFACLISGILMGTRSVKTKTGLLVILAAIALGALYRWNVGFLIAMVMLSPFPTLGGYALGRSKKTRIALLVFIAIIFIFVVIGKIFGAEIVMFGLFGLFALLFVVVFIMGLLGKLRSGSGYSSGSSRGWSSSSSSSSSRSSFSGGGGASGSW